MAYDVTNPDTPQNVAMAKAWADFATGTFSSTDKLIYERGFSDGWKSGVKTEQEFQRYSKQEGYER